MTRREDQATFAVVGATGLPVRPDAQVPIGDPEDDEGGIGYDDEDDEDDDDLDEGEEDDGE